MSSGPLWAQTPAAVVPEPVERTYVQGGLGLAVAGAVGAFGTNVDAAGGLTAHVGVGVGRSPLSIGGEITFLQYGEESRRVSLAPLVPEVPDASVKVSTTNNVLLGHTRLRVQPRSGRWRPYADALAGFNYISTSSSVEVTDRSMPGAKALSDIGASYGGGAGVTVGFGTPPSTTRLDVSLRFIGGSTVDYLRKGAVRYEDGQAVLEPSRSRTDMVVLYIGVSWATR